MKNIYKLSLAAVAASLVLVSCGSVEDLVEEYVGDEDSTSEGVNKFVGQFIDTNVQGLNYTCSSGPTGVTDSKGTFTCNEGDDVTFSLGKYVLGSATLYDNSKPIITPHNLNSMTAAGKLDVAQLLQTLDSDTSDGVLTIPDNFNTLNGSDIVPDNSDFDLAMASALGVESLISVEVATAHLMTSYTNAGLEEAASRLTEDTRYLAEQANDFEEELTVEEPTNTGSLVDFVSGKVFSYTDNTLNSDRVILRATFSTNGDYYEVFDDADNVEAEELGTCSGKWTVLSEGGKDYIGVSCDGTTFIPTTLDNAGLVYDFDKNGGVIIYSNEGGHFNKHEGTVTFTDI